MPRHGRTEAEIQTIHQLYDAAKQEHGCGYYPVCYEHDCSCSLDAPVSKGFDIKVWDRLADEFDRAHAEFYRDQEEDDWPENDDDW